MQHRGDAQRRDLRGLPVTPSAVARINGESRDTGCGISSVLSIDVWSLLWFLLFSKFRSVAKQLDTLREYYQKLLVWEKVEACELVADWPQAAADSVESDIRRACEAVRITVGHIALRDGSENQAIGNQMADHFRALIAPALSEWELIACSGAGYPDLMLSKGEIAVAVEVKATSEWNEKDSNRIVLTSSSKKLRTRFKPPIYHLLVTLQYALVGSFRACIHKVRLDFLAPSTFVNIRLEGSVSQKLLSEASHRTTFME